MNKLSLRLIAIAMLAASAVGIATARTWEPVKTENHDLRSIAKETDIEIRSGQGEVIVVTNRQVQIKLFSILGQLISTETLSPGTHRLSSTPHGVYIIKAGELTCKIVI